MRASDDAPKVELIGPYRSVIPHGARCTRFSTTPDLRRLPQEDSLRKPPSFSSPPVVEVVVGVAIKPLSRLTAAHAGALWRDVLAASFPTVEERQPYEPLMERFGPSDIALGTFEVKLQFQATPPLPRLLFTDEKGEEAVQLQTNWLAANWRRVAPHDEYGRWPGRRKAFIESYTKVNDWLQRNEIGELLPEQCEITYVNHVVADKGWENHSELGEIVTLISDRSTEAGPEQMNVQASYIITDSSGAPRGRVHLHAQPLFRRDDLRPMYSLTYTARGRPSNPGLEGSLEILDVARDRLLEVFMSTTTSKMHEIWGYEG